MRRVRPSFVEAAYARSFVETTVLFVASLTLRCSPTGGRLTALRMRCTVADDHVVVNGQTL